MIKSPQVQSLASFYGQGVAMSHTTGYSCRLHELARKIILAVFLFSGGNTLAQTPPKAWKGTVNIALANANGIVLLTDSAQSYKDVTGVHTRKEPAQKLFRLDDKTVCSIAGFGSETGWLRPELNVEVSGIIAEIRDQLSRQPVPDLDGKLRAIGYLVGSYIDIVATRHEAAEGPGSTSDYVFEVIVAGYDSDGKPKLKKLVLTPEIAESSNGHRYWTHTVWPEEESSVEAKLTHLLGGIPNVSIQVLQHPEAFGTNAVIQKYARAKKDDGGKSLTLDDLAALAHEMKELTKDQFADVVGGDDQIAVLSQGRILKIDPPHFDEAPRPLKFSLRVSLRLEGANAAEMVTAGPGYHQLWIGCEIVGLKNPPLRLDDQFFYGTEIRDSIVSYNGGLTDLGPSNKVVNSALFPYLPAGAAHGGEQKWNGFEWNLEAPDTPTLPKRIGPVSHR
jgi:hypothetical protein